MKELEWSQHFSHDQSMGIFPDAQGQLTPDLAEIQTHTSISSYGCSLSLPARMNKTQSKPKELECSKHYTYISQMLKGS